MAKSKVKVQVPEPKPERDANGVMTNFHAYHTAIQAQKVTRQLDILKPVERTTKVCLICHEFSKHTSRCPICHRMLISFGNDVKKVPKGNKRKWKKFIEAYAWSIFNSCKHIIPDHDIEQRRNKLGRISLYQDREAERISINDALNIWVHKFDKHLDQYRT